MDILDPNFLNIIFSYTDIEDFSVCYQEYKLDKEYYYKQNVRPETCLSYLITVINEDNCTELIQKVLKENKLKEENYFLYELNKLGFPISYNTWSCLKSYYELETKCTFIEIHFTELIFLFASSSSSLLIKKIMRMNLYHYSLIPGAFWMLVLMLNKDSSLFIEFYNEYFSNSVLHDKKFLSVACLFGKKEILDFLLQKEESREYLFKEEFITQLCASCVYDYNMSILTHLHKNYQIQYTTKYLLQNVTSRIYPHVGILLYKLSDQKEIDTDLVIVAALKVSNLKVVELLYENYSSFRISKKGIKDLITKGHSEQVITQFLYFIFKNKYHKEEEIIDDSLMSTAFHYSLSTRIIKSLHKYFGLGYKKEYIDLLYKKNWSFNGSMCHPSYTFNQLNLLVDNLKLSSDQYEEYARKYSGSSNRWSLFFCKKLETSVRKELVHRKKEKNIFNNNF